MTLIKVTGSAIALALSFACTAQERRMNIGVGIAPSTALNVTADKTTMSGLTGHISYYSVSKKGIVHGIGISAAQLAVGNRGTITLGSSDYIVLHREQYANPALTLMGFLGREVKFGSSSVMYGGRGGIFYAFQKYGGVGVTAGAGGAYTLHLDERKAVGVGIFPQLYYVRALQMAPSRERNAIFFLPSITVNYYLILPKTKKAVLPEEKPNEE
jgi:hypothetical protein